MYLSKFSEFPFSVSLSVPVGGIDHSEFREEQTFEEFSFLDNSSLNESVEKLGDFIRKFWPYHGTQISEENTFPVANHGLCGGYAFELEVKLTPYKKAPLFHIRIQQIYLKKLEKNLQDNYI